VFSWPRAHRRTCVKKARISRAKRSAGTPCSAGWPPSFVCCQPPPTTPARNHACTTGADWNHTLHAITSAQRALIGITSSTRSRRHNGRWRNHAQHRITRTTTGNQHHGWSNHASITGYQHDGPSNHFCTTSACTTGLCTTPAQQAPARRVLHHGHFRVAPDGHKKKACRPRSPAAELVTGRIRFTYRSVSRCHSITLE
jgi:hypothetical protein